MKTSRRKWLSDVVQIFYYMFSGIWLMMLLPRKHFLAHSGRQCSNCSVRWLSSGNVAVSQIREIICFHTEVGFLINQGYQKDLQIKNLPRICSPCLQPEHLNHADC